jgi:hypothetical protein
VFDRANDDLGARRAIEGSYAVAVGYVVFARHALGDGPRARYHQ